MHVLITGAAGMIGRKLAARLAQIGVLNGRAIKRMTLTDVVAPEAPVHAPFEIVTTKNDFRVPTIGQLIHPGRPDVIFHLAAIVSGEAEMDFHLGYRVNFIGTHDLFQAILSSGNHGSISQSGDPPGHHYRPKLVFASSIAAYGAPFPDAIPDDFVVAPLTSYGTQKAMSELLLADFARRRYFDGVGIRLPTIVVRPGAPNKAASSFFSSIIREPLNGHDAVLPVDEDVRHWFASPRAAVGFLIHAAGLTSNQLGPRVNLTMPGLSGAVGEMIVALERIAGPKVAARIRREPNETVARIVAGWPQNFDARRAEALGFRRKLPHCLGAST
jgi:nucleoside-diphosphate-sugar epimerase